MDAIVECCAGLDVHQATVVACVNSGASNTPVLQGGPHLRHDPHGPGGYTLCDAGSGASVARLRPTGAEGRFEVLLLVAVERPMGFHRSVRTHHPVDPRRPGVYRPRGYLLGHDLNDPI